MRKLYTIILVCNTLIALSQDKKIKTEERTFLNKENKITGFQLVEYDAAGRIISSKYFNGNKTLESSAIHEFDENGNPSKEINYDSEGKIEDFWNHYPDQNGNDTLLKYGFPKRNEYYFEKYKNTYDKENKLIKEERCQNNDTVNFVYVFSYNTKGEKTSMLSYLYEEPSEDFYYAYDNKGRLIEEKLFSPDDEGKQEINTIWQYEYADDNLLVKETVSSLASYLEEKTVNIYTHQYKKKKKLVIEETELKNNVVEEKTKYKYTFY